MSTYFYSLSLLFIWVEWVQFRKKSIIYSENYLSLNKFKLFLFFISKLINVVSLFIGLFTPLYYYYVTIIVIENLKLVLLYTKNVKLINLVNLISVFVYILIYMIIFVRGVVL